MTPADPSLAQARAWAAATLPASRAALLAAPGEPDYPEPGQAEALLAGLATRAAAPEAVSAAPPEPGAGPPHAMGVGELLGAYGRGLDPRDVVAALLARARGPDREAVLCAAPGAEAAAADSAARWRAGAARPLEGVPFGVKDIIDVAGAPVTCGSLHTGDRRPVADATCVARLRAAGAIPLLILATSEFACGAAANARHGTVPNPWDRTRWAGGSSTGSGAALAQRLVPLALGTDTGGSIRVPAALCGITGFKPTRGLVPRTGVATLSWTLDHVGPMARSAACIARVLPVLAGPDGTDPLAAATLPDLSRAPDVAGLRIGVPDGWFVERCDAAVLAAWRGALDVLAQAGAVLRPVSLPDPALAHEEGWTLLYAELAAGQEARFDRMALFDVGTRDRIARGREVPATDYLRALRRRPAVMRAMLAAMAEVDVVVTPGPGAEAPRLSDMSVEVDGARWPMYEVTPRNTMIFDLVGFPALMLPAGNGPSGLPLGVQVVAPAFRDALCLSVGMALQAATRHHLAMPTSLETGTR